MTFLKGYIPWNKGKTGIFSEETLKKMSKDKIGKPLSSEHRNKISESLKGNIPWNKGISGYSTSFKGKRHSLETRRRMSKARKGYIMPEKTKKKISESTKGEKNHNYGKPFSKETIQKMREVRLSHIIPTRDTSIEIVLQKELDKRGIKYKKHISLYGICQPDIIFQEKKVIIQADGDYWHSLPEVKLRDKYQDCVLKENGWQIFRFWGHEIREKVEGCIDQVEEVLNV